MTSLASQLVATLRSVAHAFAPGDQVAPCAVLWPDPDRLWEGVIQALQVEVPELFVLGAYAPEGRIGPAVWLRCIEARVVAGASPSGTVPIFYLPGISKDVLRAAEDCPPALAALVELQYRGGVWLHVNGKEWTPYAFLVSTHAGLGLDVAKDQDTLDALGGALSVVLQEPLSRLQGRRLSSEFFNGLVAPDAAGLLLRWMDTPDAFRQRRSDPEWRAFCEQCRSEFHFDPETDGPLKAAKLLAERDNSWSNVWQRFAEAPGSYPGLVDWLRKATPKTRTMFDSAEVWPAINDEEERALHADLKALDDRPSDEVIRRLADLEKRHGPRRGYPWQRLGQNPLATALAPLARLAALCVTTPGAPTPESFAAYYSETGWQVDAAALATMAACTSPDLHAPVLNAVRAVYLPWLETTSRHLQRLLADDVRAVSKRAKPIAPAPGRLLLFADGLRMDVAEQLLRALSGADISATRDWEWSTIPAVTATAKPAAAPVAAVVEGGEADDAFCTRLRSTGQLLTQPRFIAALEETGWQTLDGTETGDPTGAAWTEVGTIDKRGHNEGWKLARSIDAEIRDIVSRIGALLRAGWSELIVVTDHGWLLVPGGLPKVELKSFLAEHRWGRAAALKSTAQTDTLVYPWHWNPEVSIATPPGVGCYRASMESYTHGGVSLQEMVTPVLRISAGSRPARSARIVDAKWTGAKCRVSVEGAGSGVRVDLRTSQADPSTSLLADKLSRETTADGKVTIFLEDDATIGQQAEIVLIDPSGQVIDALPTTLGA